MVMKMELKIVYSPRGNFNLREFHHAVNNLPSDGFLPELCESGMTRSSTRDAKLAKLLSNKALFSWGSKDILRKVILITSCLLQNTDTLRETLADAAEQCVSVEFVVLEQEACQNDDTCENAKEFMNSISDLENCLLRSYYPDTRVLAGLVKRWLQELKDEIEEPLQAFFLFKNSLIGSVKQIFCNLFASATHIIDGFSPCQACRCHGLPVDGPVGYQAKRPSSCPVTAHELGACDLVENAMRVGEQTILFLPSFQSCPKLQRVSTPIAFNVVERTNLVSLSEGVVMGTSCVVTPSSCHEMESASDGYDKSELNIQLFHGLCQTLHSLDQGLVCSSNCNTGTMCEATFQCFYILQPSDKGPMLLRRLAASEEILPIPDTIESMDPSTPKEIEDSIQASLSKVELRDYNPLLHERGFHPKLNCLVKESLHFGSIPPKRTKTRSKELKFNSPNPQQPSDVSTQPTSTKTEATVNAETQSVQTAVDVDKTADCITEEWEQLIVNEVSQNYSPTCISKPKFENLASSASDSQRPLDEKTSRILERLEAPREQKNKGSSPSVVVSNVKRDGRGPMKKPLVPFVPGCAMDQGLSLSQPIKPNFQKAKRKLR
ncbi:uncharacterized protein LOC131246500 isoform X4 [Magnolia sinica]|uniref:uncharacterized protein LOC131246500 isoform X4 n=1 Tax=Magnolia sinica TaxID=86752 RepID=UPI0026589E5D|nr:uncharacterized protein LOC131246500 isoform X4 [Magnolia sinica]